MKVKFGDIFSLLRKKEFDLMVHGCNCFCTMGSGIALSVKEKYPAAYEIDLLTACGDEEKLGACSWVKDESGVIIVNAYTQFRYGTDKRHVDYDALRSCFANIAERFPDKRICYPLIGAGLAGGDWSVISKIIDEELDGLDHTLVVLNKETYERLN